MINITPWVGSDAGGTDEKYLWSTRYPGDGCFLSRFGDLGGVVPHESTFNCGY